jgi:hypothetical protein
MRPTAAGDLRLPPCPLGRCDRRARGAAPGHATSLWRTAGAPHLGGARSSDKDKDGKGKKDGTPSTKGGAGTANSSAATPTPASKNPDGKADVKADGKANPKTDGKADAKADAKADGNDSGKADGKGKKDAGKDSKSADGKSEGSSDGKTPDGDKAGGGILPGDFPLFRLIFQNLARYLGIEQLARKLLEAVYMLKPELFNDIVAKLKKLRDSLVSDELKDKLGDLNALIERLAPLLGEIDGAIDKLSTEGVGKLLDQLVDKGLDRLTEAGLDRLSKETGIPINLLRDLKSLPKGFDPAMAVEKLKNAARDEAWKAVENKLVDLGVPPDIAAVLKGGDPKVIAGKSVEYAKKRATKELEKAAGLPAGLLDDAMGDAARRKVGADKALDWFAGEAAKRTGIAPAAIKSLMTRDVAGLRDQMMESARKELRDRLPIAQSLLDSPNEKWPQKAMREVLTRELERHSVPGALATKLGDELSQGKIKEASQTVGNYLKDEGTKRLHEQGIDPELVDAVHKGNAEAIAARIRTLPAAALTKLADAKIVSRETIDAVLKSASVADAGARLREEVRKATAKAVADMGLAGVVSDTGIDLVAAKQWAIRKGIDAAKEQLKAMTGADVPPEQLAKVADLLVKLRDGKLRSVAKEVGEITGLGEEGIKALLDANEQALLESVRARLLQPAIEKLLEKAGLAVPKGSDLSTLLKSASGEARKSAAALLEKQFPAFNGLTSQIGQIGQIGDADLSAAWLKKKAEDVMRQAADSARLPAELVAHLSAGRWKQAVETLRKIDEPSLKQLVSLQALPAEAAEWAKDTGADLPQRIEARWREFLVDRLVDPKGLGLDPALADAVVRNVPETVKKSVGAWRDDFVRRALPQIPSDAQAIFAPLINNRPDDAAKAIETSLGREARKQLGLPADFAGTWQDLQKKEAEICKGLRDSGLAAALGGGSFADFEAGNLGKIREQDLRKAILARVQRESLEAVARELKVDPADLARFLQNASIAELPDAVRKVSADAKNEVRKRIDEKLDALGQSVVERQRVIEALGNHALRGGVALRPAETLRFEFPTTRFRTGERLVARVIGVGEVDVQTDLGSPQRIRLDGATIVDLGSLRGPGVYRARVSGPTCIATAVLIVERRGADLEVAAATGTNADLTTLPATLAQHLQAGLTRKRLLEAAKSALPRWIAQNADSLKSTPLNGVIRIVPGDARPIVAGAGAMSDVAAEVFLEAIRSLEADRLISIQESKTLERAIRLKSFAFAVASTNDDFPNAVVRVAADVETIQVGSNRLCIGFASGGDDDSKPFLVIKAAN